MFPLHFYQQELKIKAPESFISVTMFLEKCFQMVCMISMSG